MIKTSIETTSYFSTGSRLKVGGLLEEHRLRKGLFLIDEKLIDLPVITETIDALKSNSGVMEIASSGEPTYNYMDEVAEKARSFNFDSIVAIGGGTVLDVAKGLGILMNNSGKAIDYRGMNKVENRGVPVVLMPTTAGTGSEVTKTASFIDSDDKKKLGINGNNVNCLFSVLDPELTLSCPKSVTLSAGLDAMLHSLEAIDCKTRSRFSRLTGAAAMELLFPALPKVIKNPNDVDARGDMLLGSYYAGMAMWNAGGGPASGISYPLGVYFKVPHGIAGGIFLPHMLEFNTEKGYDGYDELADRLFGAEVTTMSSLEKSKYFAVKFREMYKEVGGSVNLSGFGVKKSDLKLLTDLTMEQRLENLNLTPVPFARKDVEWLLGEVTE